MKVKLNPNEVVLKAADTCHASGKDETRGKLIMTNQRLYFRPADAGALHKSIEILPGEIRDILFYNVFQVFPRGLDLVTLDGRTFRFSLKDRKEWCRQIAMMG